MNTKKVLIVDDEMGIVEMMALYIQKKGFQVYKAYNGKEALDLVVKGQHIIDMVISDVRMPEMDGFKLLEEIRKFNPKVPVVLLVSGYTEYSNEDAQKAGAIGLLNKPVDLQKLVDLIHTNSP